MSTTVDQAGAEAELARLHLIDFCELLIPGFEAAPHLRVIADLLEEMESAREAKRILATVFPGSGKSTLLSAFCAWYLGKNPRRRIIATSAAAELAERNSRATREFFTHDLWPFDARLSEKSSAMNRWDTTEGGGLFAVGASGTITGWRAGTKGEPFGGLILCDDMQNVYGSEAEQTALENWFHSTLEQRCDPGASIVVCQQRLGANDLPGRLIDGPGGHAWHVVRMPALAEENDPIFNRKRGESLWPQRWPVSEILKRREAMGTRAFETIWQGNPVSDAGNLIKREWLRYVKTMPTEYDKTVFGIDSASSVEKSADFSVICVLSVLKNKFYVRDIIRRRVDFNGLRRMTEEAYAQYNPATILLEKSSNGIPLLSELRRESRLPVVGVQAKGSKLSRIEGISGTIEAGRLHLPEEAPWLVEFERDVLSFPFGKTDDVCDALEISLTALKQSSGNNFFFATLSNQRGDGMRIKNLHVFDSQGEVQPRQAPNVARLVQLRAELAKLEANAALPCSKTWTLRDCDYAAHTLTTQRPILEAQIAELEAANPPSPST